MKLNAGKRNLTTIFRVDISMKSVILVGIRVMKCHQDAVRRLKC